MNNNLISRKALLERIEKDAPWWWKNFHSFRIVDMIQDAPSVDAEPVRHGEWSTGRYPGNDDCRCSICGKFTNVNARPGGVSQRYCPKCGAKMDGGNM